MLTATAPLYDIKMFETLPDSELEWLSNLTKELTFTRGSMIYKPGQFSDTLFFLKSGLVKIGVNNHENKEVIKMLIHPGEVFGELCLVDEKVRKDFAISMESNTEVIAVRKIDFKLLMRSNPDLSYQIMTLIGKRFRTMETKLESMIFKNSRDRILDFLKEQAMKMGKRIGYETLLGYQFTHQDIANITGTSRQTVTIVFNELRKSNIIHTTRKSLLIRDISMLAS